MLHLPRQTTARFAAASVVCGCLRAHTRARRQGEEDQPVLDAALAEVYAEEDWAATGMHLVAKAAPLTPPPQIAAALSSAGSTSPSDFGPEFCEPTVSPPCGAEVGAVASVSSQLGAAASSRSAARAARRAELEKERRELRKEEKNEKARRVRLGKKLQGFHTVGGVSTKWPRSLPYHAVVWAAVTTSVGAVA